MHPFEKKVFDTIKRYNLISEGDKIIVGFSGGPDSVALLHFLSKFKTNLKIELLTIHINHLIRETANRDEEFCINFCNKKNIEILTFREDVPSFAKENKLSLEEAGRVVRYSIFEKILKDRNFSKIATAHHLDDNIETFLLRLFKGTSIGGLAPIKPKSNNLIRPLIKCTKNEILRYIKNQKLTYVVDETNYDILYERNYVRSIIIPQIESKFPTFKTKMDSLIDDITEIQKLTNKISSRLTKKYTTTEKNTIIINYNELNKYNKFLIKETIKKCLNKANIKITRKIIESIINPVTEGNKILSTFKEFEIIKEYNKIIISKKDKPIQDKKSFTIDGIKITSYFDVEVEIKEINVDEKVIELAKKDSKEKTIWINIGDSKEIVIRPRNYGDIIQLTIGKKKIKDILIDEKVPLHIRRKTKVIEVDNKVAGVVYTKIRVSKEFLLSKGINKVCKIRFKE